MRGRALLIFEAGLAIWVMVLISICCVYIWPNDEKLASWVQAIGSIGAIIGAAVGIAWQINDNALRAAEVAQAETDRQAMAFRNEVANLLKAIHSELQAYRTTLSKIQKSMDENEALREHGIFNLVYAPMTSGFVVYAGCTAKLGLIAEDKLRTDIVRIYAELDATIAMLNMNSQHAARLHDQVNEADRSRVVLERMSPNLMKAIRNSETEVARICEEIDHAVSYTGCAPVHGRSCMDRFHNFAQNAVETT